MTEGVGPPGNARVVALGASAGGVPALSRVIGGLRADLAAAVFVVLHLPSSGTSVLPTILTRAGPLHAAVPRDREPIVTGQVYVAPPDRHLLVEDSVVRVVRGPWENGHRPSIDVLFRSVAECHGDGAGGAVLTGALYDGASGLAAIARHGGTALVQDPTEAEVPDMPLAALEAVPVAEPLPTDAIAARINELAAGAPPQVVKVASSPRSRLEPTAERVGELAIASGARLTPEELHLHATGLTCPDCNGSLFEIADGSVERFRCRVGHAWTAEALSESQGRGVEHALYAALRILEDRQSLQHRMAANALRRGRRRAAQVLHQRMDDQATLIETLRDAIAAFGSGGELDDAETQDGEATSAEIG